MCSLSNKSHLMVFRDSDVVQEVHERMEEVRTRKRTRRQSLAVNASVLARKRMVVLGYVWMLGIQGVPTFSRHTAGGDL